MDSANSLLIPVSLYAAEQWLLGCKSDRDLLLGAAKVAEAVFIVALPDLRSYLSVLQAAAYWHRQGARCLITRTSHPVVARHLLKNGAIEGAALPGEVIDQEDGFTYCDSYKVRYLVPVEGFERWIAKFT